MTTRENNTKADIGYGGVSKSADLIYRDSSSPRHRRTTKRTSRSLEYKRRDSSDGASSPRGCSPSGQKFRGRRSAGAGSATAGVATLVFKATRSAFRCASVPRAAGVPVDESAGQMGADVACEYAVRRAKRSEHAALMVDGIKEAD